MIEVPSSQVVLVVKNLPANAGDKRRTFTPWIRKIAGLGRPPGGGYGNPLQYSCLENPHIQSGLVGYSPSGHKEADMTERLAGTQGCGACACQQGATCTVVFLWILVASIGLCSCRDAWVLSGLFRTLSLFLS